jgi:hypothetical protein
MDSGTLEMNLSGAVKLGEGRQREVFVHPDDPTLVVKRAINTPDWNRAEAKNCAALIKAGLADWIAPVVSLSECGTFLTMRRAEPYTGKFPARVPQCFRDLHRGNIGLLDGRVVFVDYQELRSGYQLISARWRGV